MWTLANAAKFDNTSQSGFPTSSRIFQAAVIQGRSHTNILPEHECRSFCFALSSTRDTRLNQEIAMSGTIPSVPAPKDPQLRKLANCIRFLSMDAVQQAKSGHPGMPMGMADIAAVLFSDS
jgi:hypothetical protein